MSIPHRSIAALAIASVLNGPPLLCAAELPEAVMAWGKYYQGLAKQERIERLPDAFVSDWPETCAALRDNFVKEFPGYRPVERRAPVGSASAPDYIAFDWYGTILPIPDLAYDRMAILDRMGERRMVALVLGEREGGTRVTVSTYSFPNLPELSGGYTLEREPDGGYRVHRYRLSEMIELFHSHDARMLDCETSDPKRIVDMANKVFYAAMLGPQMGGDVYPLEGDVQAWVTVVPRNEKGERNAFVDWVVGDWLHKLGISTQGELDPAVLFAFGSSHVNARRPVWSERLGEALRADTPEAWESFFTAAEAAGFRPDNLSSQRERVAK